MAKYTNISASGTTHTTLITKTSSNPSTKVRSKPLGEIKSITVVNSSSTIEPIIILFLYDGTNTYTLTRTSVPVGATFVLDDNVAFDSSTYDLKITTYHASGTVDVTVIIS
tara:strand:- start:311 stop:643 length:333 start_codon:yes stop_codon:yes gene_type:complete